jgi:uncharacterized protein YndB with AHSA1/START domain
MLRIEMSQLVNRPVERVWDVVANFDNWSLAGREFRQTSAGAMGVGATVESHRTILGLTLTLNHIVITEWEPDRTFEFSDKAPPLAQRISGRFTFEPVPEGTRITRSVEAELVGGRTVEAVFTPLFRRFWRYEFTAWKRRIEAGG